MRERRVALSYVETVTHVLSVLMIIRLRAPRAIGVDGAPLAV